MNRVAAAFVLGLALVAVAAPLFASDRPFLSIVPEGRGGTGFGALPEGTSFPWFSALFDRNHHEAALDRFCNALLVVAPLAAAAFVLARRAARPVLARVACVAATVAVAALLAAGASHREPSRDWPERVAALEQEGGAVTAWFAPVAASPWRTDLAHSLAAPSLAHPLGTDDAGRDVFARLLYGARTSLAIGIVAVSMYVAIGVLLGAAAGLFRGAVDFVALRLIEVVACFPALLLVMVLISLVEERSLFHVVLVIGLTGWPTVARLARAEFLKLREADFALAARALGLPRWRVALFHLLPNGLAPVLVVAAFGLAGAVLLESGLAFLALGDAQAASWGETLRAGRETGAWHLILAPGLLIFAAVTMMNLMAQGLRDTLDPRMAVREP